uniref:Uncharacterized protein n=1 Tax=Wuchereria bancrofti TaxID=6293 RepID=A0A1I8ETU7_WUCBA
MINKGRNGKLLDSMLRKSEFTNESFKSATYFLVFCICIQNLQDFHLNLILFVFAESFQKCLVISFCISPSLLLSPKMFQLMHQAEAAAVHYWSATSRQHVSESSLTVKLEKSKDSEHIESTFIPELTTTLIKELKWKRVVRKSRKQVNTTTRKKSQYIKKTFIYRGSFLTFCSTLLGTYVMLIFLIQNCSELHQVWILISRIEIKNGTWSLSPAERITWWFDQVENLGDELGIDKMQRDNEGSVKKSDLSEDGAGNDYKNTGMLYHNKIIFKFPQKC